MLEALPTPLAHLKVTRSRRVVQTDCNARFENALLLGEASIKMTVTYLASILGLTDRQAAHVVEYDLVRASGIGDWVKAADRLATKLARQPGELSRSLAREIMKKQSKSDESGEDLWNLWEALERVTMELDADDYKLQRGRISLVQVLELFTFIRNRTRGHGAKTPDFFRRTVEDLEEFALGAFRLYRTGLNLYCFIGHDGAQTCTLLKLSGSQPQERTSVGLADAADQNSLFLLAAEGEPVACSQLLNYDSARQSYKFSNGAWKEASLKGEYLDYATGETVSLQLPKYGGPRPSLPASHTAASQLQVGKSSFHNLPSLVQDYVDRDALQEQVSKLLLDRVHRIITLKGPGGIGKTSLCLRVLRQLVENERSCFDYVAWLSGRDIDLLLEGPAPRERDIADLDSMASLFVSSFEVSTAGRADRAAFVDFMSNPERYGSVLLVVDNFETMDDPEGIHRFLDTHVVLPSKLIITSRHQTYKGDFPVEVIGMEKEEAEELIRREARNHFCEPRLDDRVIGSIVSATGGSPYAMKLAVAHFAHSSESLQQSLQSGLGREDILDALFERSYDQLSDASRYFYHLLAEIGKPCPEVVLHGLSERRQFDYKFIRKELLGYSLVYLEDNSGERALSMPYVTRLHSQRGLIGFPDEPLVKADAEEVRGLLHPRSPEGLTAKFFQEAVRRVKERGASAAHLLELCERCASDEPERWLELARELREQFSAEKINSFFKKAAELDSLNAQLWREWSNFEGSVNNEVQQVYKGIRAIELGEDNLSFCSHIAGRLLDVLRQPKMKEQFPPHRREALLHAVRGELERHRAADRLNVEELGKLGWLYFIEFSPNSDPNRNFAERAKMCAEEGLVLDSEDRHCRNLYDKCLGALGSLR